MEQYNCCCSTYYALGLDFDEWNFLHLYLEVVRKKKKKPLTILKTKRQQWIKARIMYKWIVAESEL